MKSKDNTVFRSTVSACTCAKRICCQKHWEIQSIQPRGDVIFNSNVQLMENQHKISLKHDSVRKWRGTKHQHTLKVASIATLLWNFGECWDVTNHCLHSTQRALLCSLISCIDLPHVHQKLLFHNKFHYIELDQVRWKG